jgi:TPR repeat protein
VTELPGDDEVRLNQGVAAYNNCDWDAAFELLAPLAEKGIGKAQHWLSALYRLGLGTPRDERRAWELILSAVRNDHEPARRHVADAYLNIAGPLAPAQYREQALQWLAEDAAAGRPRAQLQLGFAYLYGFQPFRRDARHALTWFSRAARQGDAVAALQLGEIYASDEIAAGQDFKKSLAWYRKAARQGLVRAELKLATIYERGLNGVTINPAKARAWYGNAARHGDMQAALRLVEMYEQRRRGKADAAQAAFWRAQAAGLGHAPSALQVGRGLASGKGFFVRDDKEAYVLLSLAAIRYERDGEEGLRDAGLERDEVGARLSENQRKAAQELIEGLKVRFVGDGEKWVWSPEKDA